MNSNDTTRANPRAGRRGVLGLAAAALLAGAALPWRAAAEPRNATSPAATVAQLDDALLAAMKAGQATPFVERYRALAPVIEQVFDLDAVLASSIGLAWATLPEADKARLAAAFRRYTISTFVANFDSYNDQRFQLLPGVRQVGNGEVVVPTKLVDADGSSVALDYVMRGRPDGWKAVDVLTDGSISRVAVQRSDFRSLLNNGGVSALVAGLNRKVANLSGGVV